MQRLRKRAKHNSIRNSLCFEAQMTSHPPPTPRSDARRSKNWADNRFLYSFYSQHRKWMKPLHNHKRKIRKKCRSFVTIYCLNDKNRNKMKQTKSGSNAMSFEWNWMKQTFPSLLGKGSGTRNIDRNDFKYECWKGVWTLQNKESFHHWSEILHLKKHERKHELKSKLVRDWNGDVLFKNSGFLKSYSSQMFALWNHPMTTDCWLLDAFPLRLDD